MDNITLKDQWNKIKDNWLIVLIVVIVFLFMFGGNLFGSTLGRTLSVSKVDSLGIVAESVAYDQGYFPPPSSGDFAPEVEERKITKTTNIATEVERGKFKDAESKVLNIVKSSDSILLNQNSRKTGKGRKSYYTGSYSIKVDTTKYDSVVSQLKDIGEVTSFNENTQDITAVFENLNDRSATEKARLARFEKLLDESTRVEDKIQLTDRIFNMERTIKYLEDSLKNQGLRVEYSTISLTLNEERSDYVNVVFVKISELIKGFVGSLNLLLKFIFYIIPWAIAYYLIRFIIRFIKRKIQPTGKIVKKI